MLTCGHDVAIAQSKCGYCTRPISDNPSTDGGGHSGTPRSTSQQSYWKLMAANGGNHGCCQVSIFLEMALRPFAMWVVVTGIRVINNDNDKRICEGRKEMRYQVLGRVRGKERGRARSKYIAQTYESFKGQIQISLTGKSHFFPKLLKVKF